MIKKSVSRWVPTGPRMVFFLILLLILDVALLIFLKKSPVCIETSLISEFEWISNSQTQFKVYTCQSKKEGALSSVLFERLSEIQKRLAILEATIKPHFSPRNPIKIVVFNGDGESVQISSSEIKLSENYFFNRELILEKSFLRSWLQQMSNQKGLGLFQLETLAHFLMWNLGHENRYYGKWLASLIEWPHMLTSWGGYCQSPIKDPTYTALCSSDSLSTSSQALSPMSLGLWFAHVFWNTFQLLSVSDQIRFFSILPQFVEELSRNTVSSLEPKTLGEIEQFALAEAEQWKSSLERLGFQEWGWTFYAKLEKDIHPSDGSLAPIDLLVKKTDSAWSVQELETLQALALEDTKYRIMGETEDGLWNFPWLSPLEKKTFPALKTQHMVWITCEWPRVKDILSIQNARKVILVQDCSPKSSKLIYSGLVHRGLQFFSLDNKDVKFILVNIEGFRFLAKKNAELLQMQLGISNLREKKAAHLLSAKAHWASAIWNQQYRAYEVSSMIDAVEWFKLPENEWPDLIRL